MPMDWLVMMGEVDSQALSDDEEVNLRASGDRDNRPGSRPNSGWLGGRTCASKSEWKDSISSEKASLI